MRLVRILTRPNLGGPMLQAIQLWHAMRALGVRTVLVVGQCQPGESAVDLRACGIPLLGWHDLAPDCEGILPLPQLSNSWPWLGERAALQHLTAVLQRTQPEVVHTHTSKAGWLGRRAAAACAIPVVAHTFHGHVLRDYFGPIRSRLLARLERKLARTTHLLFAVSHSCADELAALGVAPRERFHIVPPAVARMPMLSRAAARQRLGASEHDTLLACVGRLVPVKRVDHFLACVEELPDAHGHVFGDGPLGPHLGQRARSQPRIHMHGSDPAVRTLLPAFDALVLPSRREGLPLVAVEAFEAGVPVVGYHVPGTLDAVRLGSGFLIEERAGPSGLAAMVRHLQQVPDLRARCIAAGVAARAQFDPERIAAQLIQAYRSASAHHCR
jgi:glycosyltransferase involved in cell wall biosynthesis